MKKLRIITLIIGFGYGAFAQEMSADLTIAIKNDDSVKASQLITKENVNNCHENYSALAKTIRYSASKCFNLLIEKGADVNKICDAYVPPLMHAAKYGELVMVKTLISKGANVNYKYEGENPNIKDMTPLSYAEKFKQTEVADYLRSLTIGQPK